MCIRDSSNTTFCAEFSVFLKPVSVNCDRRMLSISQIDDGSGDEFTGFMPEQLRELGRNSAAADQQDSDSDIHWKL